jgi:hypothetical protein
MPSARLSTASKRLHLMATAIRPPEVAETIFTVVDEPFATALLPDPDLDVSGWADEYRVLSRVSAGEPGRWRTSLASCRAPGVPCAAGGGAADHRGQRCQGAPGKRGERRAGRGLPNRPKASCGIRKMEKRIVARYAQIAYSRKARLTRR